MGAAESVLAKLLARYGPIAARELAPAAERMAPETIEQVSKPVFEEILAKAGGWLEEILGREAPGAAAAVTRAAPRAMVQAPSPEAPVPLKLLSKLQKYSHYGREFGEAAGGAPGAAPNPFAAGAAAEEMPTAEQMASALSSGPVSSTARGGVPPEVSRNVTEMLQRPQGAEQSKMMDRLSGLLEKFGAKRSFEGREKVTPAITRLRAVLQPRGPVAPETESALTRLQGLEAPSPEVPEGFPVTKVPYRAPRVQQPNVPPGFDLFRTRGLKKLTLPPQEREFIEQLVASGQLPKEILSDVGPMQGLLEKLYGFRPKALLGEAGEMKISPSEEGRLWAQFQALSPEQTLERIGTPATSGVLRKLLPFSRAGEAVPEYQKLGETRPAKDIVADLLRGGPSPTGRGEFAEKVLFPISKKRAERGLPTGQPLGVEDILNALSGAGSEKFLRTSPSLASLPSTMARKEFIQRVLRILQKVQAREALGK